MKKYLIQTVFTIFILIVSNQLLQSQCTQCTDPPTGVGASAIGYQTIASGDYSFSSGYESQATGLHSTAIGYQAKSTHIRSISIGTKAESYGGHSIAIGKNITANSNSSMVIGTGYGMNASQHLTNHYPHSLMVGFNSSKSTFFVSESPSINKTGRIGIGDIMTPQAKLHIMADDNEDADLLLQPENSDYFAKLYFGDTTNRISSKGNDNLEFNTAETFYFNGNNVGIHNDTALAPLHIGEDWTFFTTSVTGHGTTKDRIIAYNAYSTNKDSLRRITGGESSSIRFTSNGDIRIETAIFAEADSIIDFHNALWVSEGKVGVKKSPLYPLDVKGTTRTDSLLAGYIFSSKIVSPDIHSSYIYTHLLNANRIDNDTLTSLNITSNYLTADKTTTDTLVSQYIMVDSIHTDDFYVDGILHFHQAHMLDSLFYENLTINN